MPYDNNAKVSVPAMHVGDEPMTIHIGQIHNPDGPGARFAYVVVQGGEIRIQGDDLYGPDHGIWPEAEDMAVTLASFLGATYECGELSEHGRSYTPAEQEWLADQALRFGMWASDMQES